jgi:hypothetical protein
MDVEKTLCGSGRLEPLHLALSSPHTLGRCGTKVDLSVVVQFSSSGMATAPIAQAQRSLRPASRNGRLRSGSRSRWPGRSAGCRPVPSNRARQKARQPASPRPRTRSSNPVPSSSESANFQYLSVRVISSADAMTVAEWRSATISLGWWCALLDLRPAGRRSGKQCGNNQNCQDMFHGAHSRKGRSSLHLHRGGSGRVLLSNTYPLHADRWRPLVIKATVSLWSRHSFSHRAPENHGHQ